MGPNAVLYISDRNDPQAEPELVDKDSSDLKDAPFVFTLGRSVLLHFTGIRTNYFALLLEPGEGGLLRQVTFAALEDSGKAEDAVEEFRRERGAEPTAARLEAMRQGARTNVRADLLLGVRIPGQGEVASQDFMFFAGPKSADLMKHEPYTRFYPLIEDSYGWSFAWINKTLIWILKQFHNLFGNWGVAIIFLTFVVKGLLFPLNRVQQVSMYKYQQKMNKLKPKLDELKKKYKNNKKKYNEEQMKLMREHGATPPLLGCLLVFLQFPVFIGLFQALRTSFELRHSPFCLWIKDLSQPDAMPLPFALPLVGDTLNVVPIMMTLAFFFQQKAMPKPADPQQQQTQKIMMFMPFIFGIMFYGYASGLSLYWMTSNLISIVEYKFIRKKFPVGGTVEKAPDAAPQKESGDSGGQQDSKKPKGNRRTRRAARKA
jgi:YidC/Oxa1 family membrane protein insertase